MRFGMHVYGIAMEYGPLGSNDIGGVILKGGMRLELLHFSRYKDDGTELR